MTSAQRSQPYTIGVEEEYQIVDADSRQLVRGADRVLGEAQATLGEQVQPELQRSQLEGITPICSTLSEVRAELVRLRSAVIAAAATEGNCVVAAGSHPFSHWESQQVTPKERYEGIEAQYRQLA